MLTTISLFEHLRQFIDKATPISDRKRVTPGTVAIEGGRAYLRAQDLYWFMREAGHGVEEVRSAFLELKAAHPAESFEHLEPGAAELYAVPISYLEDR